ncbi:MAG: hypothetical protein WBM98_14250 [Maribacter sp.]|uniref:hypothetical protein n=1 Tax=Maribacter sp. TaxID=1897614 RepID=UPI003C73E037
MIEDELMKIWQSSSNQERLNFEKSRLILELDSSLGRLHRWWWYMEQVNFISAMITIPPLIFAVYWVPFTSMKIASVLVIIWAIYIGIRMKGIKKFKPSDLEENYLHYLEKTRSYLFAQKRMLETSLNWAILTIYPIYLLFFVGLWERPLARYIGVISFLVLVGVGVYEYHLSKKRVKNEIAPRIARVDTLIKELKE